LNQKLKGIDYSGLNAIEKKKIMESLSLFYKNETKDKENNDSHMASEMGNPWNHPIQHR